MNQMETAKKILDTAIQTGMAEITPSWKVYTKEHLEKDKTIDLFTRNRMITMKGGKKCPFVIMPSNTSTPGGFDYFKCGDEKMAHFQIFSVLFNGEPDRLEDYGAA